MQSSEPGGRRTRLAPLALTASSWATALLALCLSGYASVSQARPLSERPIKENEGIVLLSITNNTGLASARIDSVYLMRVPEPNERGGKRGEIIANVTNGLGSDTAMFIGVAAAGSYTIDGINSPEGRVSLNDNTDVLLGTVRVEAGAVADLGRLLMTPNRSRILVGRSEFPIPNIDLVRRYWPEYAAQLDRPVVEGFTKLRALNDQTEAYALDRPVGAKAPVELPSGEVLAATRLGTLLVRSRYGVWRPTHTGRLESLLFVAPTPSGDVDGQPAVAVAVGEYNTIARLAPDGNLASLDGGNLPPGTLLFVGGSSDLGWYVAHREAGGQVSIYRSARLGGGSWELLRTTSVDFRPFVDWFRFWIWPSSNGLAYAAGASIHELDYQTGAWIERRSPNDLNFVEVIGRSDGTITATAARVGVIAMSAYVSHNGGADWVPISGPSTVRYLPRVLPDGTLLTIDGKVMKPELQSSTDGGATWTARGEVFRRVEDIVVLPTLGVLAIDGGQVEQPDTIYAQLGNPRIRHSADGGVTWRAEYSAWR